MTALVRIDAAATHPADAHARQQLLAAAAAQSLDVRGGALLRTSSRLCLGVEHGDYNGTDLFGVGTDRFLWIAFRPNDRGRVRLFSVNEPQDGVVEFDPRAVPAPAAAPARGWARFPLGAAHVLQRGDGARAATSLPRGLDAVVFGDIPGGGMSRSASLSINLLLVLLLANGHTPADGDRMRIAQLACAIENDYVGSPCGLLDQVMICFARRDTGTLYSPHTGAVAHVPLGGDPDRQALLCLFTGRARHGLQNATYPVRRAECERLLALLRPEFGIACLADVRSDQQLQAVLQRHGRQHPDLCARLRYLHSAQQRLARMIAAWRDGDLPTLGDLFRADGHGLRDLYRISGPELETMCDIARTVPGVLGERMLGGGDCGTTGVLALPEAVAAVRAAVATAYPRSHPEFAAAAAVHACRTTDGIALLPPL